ncbi:transporter substrate-binding domain-containing protein [Shewanella waksmanii]|uniref:substrate-binding periplasmic protein n=1 Tax=Shewanella waksmanii TaxID=213783 RepID=UPI0004BAF18F
MNHICQGIRWCGLIALCWLNVQVSNAATLHLSTLHWPPYCAEKLPQQGGSVAVARAALQAMGHDLEVDFYPWSRAVRLPHMQGSQYAGYFPEYLHPNDKVLFSKVSGHSELVIIERPLDPISWSKVSDLQQYRIGTVKDYINTPELDAAIANGLQKVEEVTSDEHNVKKVATGRIDAAVIDRQVFMHLLAQPHLKPLATKLQVNKKSLARISLHIAFIDSEQGQYWRDIYDKGLKKIDADKVLAEYFSRYQ